MFQNSYFAKHLRAIASNFDEDNFSLVLISSPQIFMKYYNRLKVRPSSRLQKQSPDVFIRNGILPNNENGGVAVPLITVTKKLRHRCFHVTFQEIFQNTFFVEHPHVTTSMSYSKIP